MKILHLSTGDSKGAFFGAYRTHTNLKKYGHESSMCVVEKTSHDKDVIELSQNKRKIFSIFGRLMRRFFVRRGGPEDKIYLIYNTTFSVSEIFKKYRTKPDLIIVYFVADYLSDHDILKIQKHYGCPVAFYLMDAAMFTGGCHYPWNCEGYKVDCDNCPAMKYPELIKLPKNIFHKRKKYYMQMDCFFLSASKWLDDRCESSGIKAKLGIKKAIIGIDEQIFKPRTKVVANDIIDVQIPAGNRVIFLGAQSLSDPRKGVKYVLDALAFIRKNFPNLLTGVSILTVGDQAQATLPEGISFVNIGFIHDKDKYPYLYNLADGFICPSIEDAGPMMINEALMSGVPVMAFKVGVAEDLIVDRISGFLADSITTQALANSIMEFLKLDDPSLAALKESSRQMALQRCTSQCQVKAIESLVSNQSPSA